jgi:hypothetical protein
MNQPHAIERAQRSAARDRAGPKVREPAATQSIFIPSRQRSRRREAPESPLLVRSLRPGRETKSKQMQSFSSSVSLEVPEIKTARGASVLAPVSSQRLVSPPSASCLLPAPRVSSQRLLSPPSASCLLPAPRVSSQRLVSPPTCLPPAPPRRRQPGPHRRGPGPALPGGRAGPERRAAEGDGGGVDEVGGERGEGCPDGPREEHALAHGHLEGREGGT